MKIEDQIKRTVEERVASRPSRSDAFERVQRRFRRGRRVRLATATAGAIVAIAAVATFVPRIGDERVVVPIESPTTGETQMPGSPTPVPAVPAVLVAVEAGEAPSNADDRIVLISASTGKVVRVLAEAPSNAEQLVSPFRGGASVSPDGATVYFTREGPGDPSCTSTIRSVPTGGGDESMVAEGWSPSISPNGRFLAYQGRGSGSNCSQPPLIVRDLQTGDERRWEWDAERPDDPYLSGGPFSLEWSPDSRLIAFTRNVGDPLYQVWVLDTTTGETFLDARQVSPDQSGDGPKSSWESPVFLTGTTLIAAHGTRSIHDSPDGPLHVLVSLDPATQSEPDVLFDPESAVLDISVHPASGAVLYATGTGIYRFDDGKAELIASGRYVYADW